MSQQHHGHEYRGGHPSHEGHAHHEHFHSPEAMTLDQLEIGGCSRIVAVRGQGALRDRLLDMGLTPRTEVMVRKVAPMGDPIELTLRGYELTLRSSDAKNIVIERHNHGVCTGGESELRENHAVQSTDGVQSARGKFSWRHRRAQGRRHPRP